MPHTEAISLCQQLTAEAQVNAKSHDLPLLVSDGCLRASPANIGLGRSLMLLSIASKFVGGGGVGEVGLLGDGDRLPLLFEEPLVEVKTDDGAGPTLF